MKTLDVGLCITDLEKGGAERCLFEIARRVDRRRFRPVVYCLAGVPEDPANSFVPELEATDVEVHCLGAKGVLSLPRVLGLLRRKLAAQRPHLVQTLLFHANILGRIAARRAGVERVISGIRVAQRRPRWRLWADRMTDGMVDTHVCVSSSVARFSQQTGRLPAEKLTVIPNGVDLERFPARDKADLTEFGIAKGRRAVVFAGGLDRQKGLPWAIRSAAAWMAEVPDCDLLIVGKGPQRAQFQHLAEALRIGRRVRFAGWRSDIAEIMAAGELLLLPSAWEGMPNVVLEAMASRLPVLATDVEGVAELLGPLADRQTVPYGDWQALVGKMVALLNDPQEAASLGAENRRRAEGQFGLSAMVEAYEELWDRLCHE